LAFTYIKSFTSETLLGKKMFGQQIVTDHTTAQDDLKTLGNNLNAAVSDSVDSMHASMMDTLKTLTGRSFDSVYIMRQIKDHQTVITNSQQEISSGNKSDVVHYAGNPCGCPISFNWTWYNNNKS
jgi:putative membrane protein